VGFSKKGRSNEEMTRIRLVGEEEPIVHVYSRIQHSKTPYL
jgi:hypothetical protein